VRAVCADDHLAPVQRMPHVAHDADAGPARIIARG
jgi:hypothetical protein